MSNKIRLQKYLSQAGVCSRRQAEQLIKQGRITINGKRTFQLGTKVEPNRDKVCVDAEVVAPDAEKIYIALYKPKKYITSLKDPRGRRTIKKFTYDLPSRVFPIGRLDYHSEGLLLLTNDGEFANLVMHPSSQIPKTYQVKIQGKLSTQHKRSLEEGLVIRGRKTSPAKLDFISSTTSNQWWEITIVEGRNRQVRRMFEALGYRVSKLKRVSIGPVTLKKLSPGQMRPLTKKEIDGLIALATEKQLKEND